MNQFSIVLLSLIAILAGSAWAQDDVAAGEVEAIIQAEQGYFDGKRWRKLWMNQHEVVEFGTSVQTEEWLRVNVPQAKSVMRDKKMRIWQLGQKESLENLTRGVRPSQSNHFSPVYHVSARGGSRLALAGNVVVRFKTDQTDQQLAQWADEQGLSFARAMSLPRVYLFAVDSVASVLSKANEIQRSGEVEYAMPEWWREAYKR